MVKNKKLFFIVSLILSFSLIFSGCGAKKSESYDMATEDMPPTEQWREMDNNENEESKGQYGTTEPEKIITTISISMQTKEFVDTTNKLTAIIEKHKGYVENSNIFHNNYYNSARLKYSEYTIRIPKENLNQFVIDLKEIGNIISENTSKADITKQYKDTKSRLRVLEIKEGRILDLLKKAEKMEDIIALEDQLSNIIYEKENLTANIMDMDDKVNYSTVQFQLEEVAKLIPSENIKTPFWTKIGNAFKNSMYFFTDNVENLIISFIYFLPYGLIIGILAYLVWRFIKKRKNNISKE